MPDPRCCLIGTIRAASLQHFPPICFGVTNAGHAWPEISNISAGPLGGGVSHAARYEEILMGQEYKPTDAVGTNQPRRQPPF